MFGIFRRLSALEADLKQVQAEQRDTLELVKQLDPAELTRLRQTVLNSIRSLGRAKQASEEREATAPPTKPAVNATGHPWLRGR